MAVDPNILGKIKKLLAVAVNQDGMPEGDLAAKFAADLMAKHAVSMADVEDAEVIDPIVTKEINLFQRESWVRDLAAYVARFCNCRSTFRRTTTLTHFYGHRSDVDIAEYLFDVFRREIVSRSETFMKDAKASNMVVRYGGLPTEINELPPRAKSSLRTNFCMSATVTLARRLESMKAAASPDVTTMALVVSRLKQVDQWFDDNIKYKKTVAPKWQWSAAGIRAGEEINIVNGLRGESDKKQLGN